MTNDRAPVAVVVVAWNARRWLSDCLSSLRALARPPAEIVVVDNASTDGSAAFVREAFPEVLRIEPGTNTGFCRGNNLGIAATTSPFVLALNPDTRLDPGFLEALLPAFDDPRVGAAAGKLLRFDGVTLDSAGQQLGRSRQPVDRGYGRRDDGRYDRDEEVFGVCGAAALYRRDMLRSIALADGEYFDEAYFAFYEDLDLAWRARRAGWRCVYRPAAVGFHARSATASRPAPGRFRAWLGRSPEIRFHILKNRWLTIRRNDTPRAFLRDLPWIAARDLATLALCATTSPGVLVRLFRERRVFRQAARGRRLDAGRGGNEVTAGRGAP